MPTLSTLLENLLTYSKETEWLEFKENNTKPDEIGEYISALSNSAALAEKKHGYLVFGVNDQTKAIVGTSFKPKTAKVGNEELENWLARLLSPRVDFEILELTYNTHHVVIIRIDPTKNRPVAFNGVEFIRVGSYKKKLSDFPEKERKIWALAEKWIFEKQHAKNNLNADDVLHLLDYSKYFELMKLNLPSTKVGILEKLTEEKFIEKHSAQFDITNLGAILFARDLNNFDRLARKTVRVIIYKGKNRLHTVKEYVATTGYAVGFESLIAYINDQLPVNEVIDQALRRELRVYPEIAIRELVSNAIIHQDFSESGTGPMIEIFEDRMEITNPGKPLIETARFIDHKPQSRNELLASFMRRANICEERGSGIDKVVDSIELFQLPAPKFVAEEKFLKATLYAPKTLREMNQDDKVRACYQHCCLKYVSNDVMTNESLRMRFNIAEKNYSTASRIIMDTIASGMIKRQDPDSKTRKHAKYIPYWA